MVSVLALLSPFFDLVVHRRRDDLFTITGYIILKFGGKVYVS